jgi:DNA polymerase III subunit delta
MRLRAEQLEADLAKTLRPVYVISGDEPLLALEGADAVRRRAREQGHTEREVFDVEAGFDWGGLTAACASLSLFSERRLIELRMSGCKPGAAGAQALVAYAEKPPEDAVLLLTCGKLDKAAQASEWLKALAGAGALVQVWPVEPRQLPDWITRRMRTRGLTPTPEAAALLGERVEGNLLAAAQEIDKLALLHGGGPLDAGAVAETVADSARFDIYGLADAALMGEAGRAVRMLAGLRAEGVDAVLVLWCLTREVRALASMARELARGGRPDAVLAAHRVWDKRKPIVRRALQRHDAAACRGLLRHCARADRVLKGAEAGSVWDELLELTVGLAAAQPRSSERQGG